MNDTSSEIVGSDPFLSQVCSAHVTSGRKDANDDGECHDP